MSKTAAQKDAIKNMSAVKELLDNIVVKMVAGTDAPVEIEIAHDIVSGYFEEGGTTYRQTIDECEEAYGKCPVTGLEDWPEDKNDQIMLIKGTIERITNYLANPPKSAKAVVEKQVTMVIQQRYNNKNDMPMSSIPKSDPNWGAVVLTGYDD